MGLFLVEEALLSNYLSATVNLLQNRLEVKSQFESVLWLLTCLFWLCNLLGNKNVDHKKKKQL